MTSQPNQTTLSFAQRWRIYFAERFPPHKHGILVAAFVIGLMAYSSRLHGHGTEISPASVVAAIIITFLFFLQLRVLDEFKDFEDDARWRPYRPVPRGIVTLRALGWLGVCAAGIQLALALMLAPWHVLLLVLIWGYSGLMGVEFFIRDWLRAHPVAYMASHMVIVPMIALFVMTLDLPSATPDLRIGWMLAMSYVGFCVIEIGRKIRAPDDEEQGVETYSALWGRRNAVVAWLMVIALTGIFAVGAGRQVGTSFATTVCFIVLLAACAGAGIEFLRHPLPGRGKWFELLSGAWTLAIFLVPGLAP